MWGSWVGSEVVVKWIEDGEGVVAIDIGLRMVGTMEEWREDVSNVGFGTCI